MLSGWCFIRVPTTAGMENLLKQCNIGSGDALARGRPITRARFSQQWNKSSGSVALRLVLRIGFTASKINFTNSLQRDHNMKVKTGFWFRQECMYLQISCNDA
jgi:hypothetical protein